MSHNTFDTKITSLLDASLAHMQFNDYAPALSNCIPAAILEKCKDNFVSQLVPMLDANVCEPAHNTLAVIWFKDGWAEIGWYDSINKNWRDSDKYQIYGTESAPIIGYTTILIKGKSNEYS